MDSTHGQHSANDLVRQLAQHLRQYPCDLRHARKLMRHFRASAADVAQAIDLVAVPSTLEIDPADLGDKVLLHLLQYPGDIIDIRRVMHDLHASESDVRRAFGKLEIYVVDGGEDVVCENVDKK
jgi:hypothetical protein